ncbi:hypothetical protein AB1Y20_021809 [Prymnesium parvum]|uniref:Guanine nucleotide-binding protein subunit beta-like protein n=1 Tax=Prymnesium parvum TaxID=97485 RepID=A0AB34JKT5_PRYPA|mmetsp:Transcript_28335/g.68956  ORF Transcript_28335/g.68956 Transcript_28335/m.68956 type:complete len:349 (-) Transcript_28335:473-1519(-)
MGTKDDYDKALDTFLDAQKAFKGQLTHQIAKGTPQAVAPKCVRTMQAKDLGKVYAVSWSNNDDLICAAHQEGAVTIKSALNGGHKNMPIIFPKKEEKIVPMATLFLPGDGAIAVGGMDNVITIFDRSQITCEKKKVMVNHEGYISSLKMLGDKILSGSGDSTIRLWDPSTGQEVKAFCEHDGDCSGLDCLPGNPNMFVSSSTDTTCRLWDARTGKSTRWFKAKYSVNCVSLFPTGSMLACGCDSASFEYWDINSFNQIGRGKVKRGRCETIAFSKSGALTYMGWDAPEAGYVMCAETFFVDKQAKVETGGHTETCSSMALSNDGTALVSASFDATVKIWTAPPGATGA